MKPFSEMGLNPSLVEALKKINFINATDVQEQVIPLALQRKDIVVRAKTGTGKTCAFLIPIKQMGTQTRDPEALIIVPTRELAVQIRDMANKLRFNHHGVAVVYGGASINVQMDELRRGPNIVIGTPGRIIDLMERGALRVQSLKFLVLDEADTMLDIGFIDDIEHILSDTPSTKQTLLFSATMPEKILSVARRHMHDMTFLKIGQGEELVVNQIKHLYAIVEPRQKFGALLAYVKQYNPKKAIIFAQTQYAASAIHDALKEQGFDAILLHGGLTQSRREASLRQFKGGGRFLIATNVAARGIDIVGVSDVINFDVPDDPHTYVHRVGRSARMNAEGRAFTITVPQESEAVKDIEYIARIRMDRISLNTAPFANIRVFSRGGGQRRDFHGRGGGGQGHGRDRWNRGERRGGGHRGGGGGRDHRDHHGGDRSYGNRSSNDTRVRSRFR